MEITQEMINALATLRRAPYTGSRIQDALNVLDNAGIFAAIDSASGYDITPAPERVSKCTCPELSTRTGLHLHGCPGDAAEWGDAAYTTR